MENHERPIKRRRGRPRKNISLDMDKELNQQNLSAAENSVKATANSEKPANNIEIFVKNKIKEINLQAELAKEFVASIDMKPTKKITVRVEDDILQFYSNLPGIKCTTAMKKALRIVMEAVKAQKITF